MKYTYLEEGNNGLEESNGLSSLVCVEIATRRFEGAVAGAVRGPFVFPELLILPVDVNPIILHVVERRTGAIVG